MRGKTKLLQKGILAKGFRAEGLRNINSEILNQIAEYYVYDSSFSVSNKKGSPFYSLENGLTEIAVMKALKIIRWYPLFVIYIPSALIGKIIERSLSPVVLYFHSFDFTGRPVRMVRRIAGYRRKLYYNRFGPKYLEKFEKMIYMLLNRGHSFVKMEDLLKKQ